MEITYPLMPLSVLVKQPCCPSCRQGRAGQHCSVSEGGGPGNATPLLACLLVGCKKRKFENCPCCSLRCNFAGLKGGQRLVGDVVLFLFAPSKTGDGGPAVPVGFEGGGCWDRTFWVLPYKCMHVLSRRDCKSQCVLNPEKGGSTGAVKHREACILCFLCRCASAHTFPARTRPVHWQLERVALLELPRRIVLGRPCSLRDSGRRACSANGSFYEHSKFQGWWLMSFFLTCFGDRGCKREALNGATSLAVLSAHMRFPGVGSFISKA